MDGRAAVETGVCNMGVGDTDVCDTDVDEGAGNTAVGRTAGATADVTVGRTAGSAATVRVECAPDRAPPRALGDGGATACDDGTRPPSRAVEAGDDGMKPACGAVRRLLPRVRESMRVCSICRLKRAANAGASQNGVCGRNLKVIHILLGVRWAFTACDAAYRRSNSAAGNAADRRRSGTAMRRLGDTAAQHRPPQQTNLIGPRHV